MTSRRLFRAHPAFGLYRIPEGTPPTALQELREDQLPPDWQALSDEIQDFREVEFFCRLLNYLAADDCTLEFEAPIREQRRRVAALPGVVKRRGSRFAGKLTKDLAAILPHINLVWLEVRCAGELRIELRDGWQGVLVTVTEAEQLSLTKELSF
jgi:hypothetical protein